MTIGERVKLIRQSERVNLTQEKFANRLNVARVTIARIESNEGGLTPKMETAICREFHVNQEWLRDGIGEMFAPAPITEIDTLAQRYHMTRNERILIEKILELTPEQRQAVLNFIKRTAAAMEDEEDEIEREVADYRRELELEKKAKERSSLSHDTDVG